MALNRQQVSDSILSIDENRIVSSIETLIDTELTLNYDARKGELVVILPNVPPRLYQVVAQKYRAAQWDVEFDTRTDNGFYVKLRDPQRLAPKGQ